MVLKSIDLIDEVIDVQWCPFSSTTFAIISKDGRVELWDIKKKNFDPVFLLKNEQGQEFIRRTCIYFSTIAPILLVGRDDGILDLY